MLRFLAKPIRRGWFASLSVVGCVLLSIALRPLETAADLGHNEAASWLQKITIKEKLTPETVQVLIDSKVLNHFPLVTVHSFLREHHPEVPFEDLKHPHQAPLVRTDDGTGGHEDQSAGFLPFDAVVDLEAFKAHLEDAEEESEEDDPVEDIRHLFEQTWNEHECSLWYHSERLKLEEEKVLEFRVDPEGYCGSLFGSTKDRAVEKIRSLVKPHNDDIPAVHMGACYRLNEDKKILAERKKHKDIGGKSTPWKRLKSIVLSEITEALSSVANRVKELLKKVWHFYLKHQQVIGVILALAGLTIGVLTFTGGAFAIVMLAASVLTFVGYAVSHVFQLVKPKNEMDDILRSYLLAESEEEIFPLANSNASHNKPSAKAARFIKNVLSKLGGAAKKMGELLKRGVVVLGKGLHKLFEKTLGKVWKQGLRPLIVQVPVLRNLLSSVAENVQPGEVIENSLNAVSTASDVASILEAIVTGVASPTSVIPASFGIGMAIRGIYCTASFAGKKEEMYEDLEVLGEMQCSYEPPERRQECLDRITKATLLLKQETTKPHRRHFEKAVYKIVHTKKIYGNRSDKAKKVKKEFLKKLKKEYPDHRQREIVKRELTALGVLNSYEEDQWTDIIAGLATPAYADCQDQKALLEKLVVEEDEYLKTLGKHVA